MLVIQCERKPFFSFIHRARRTSVKNEKHTFFALFLSILGARQKHERTGTFFSCHSLFTGQHQGKLDFCSRFKGNRRNPSFLRRKLATFFFIPFFHSSPISQGEKDGPLFFSLALFLSIPPDARRGVKNEAFFHFFFHPIPFTAGSEPTEKKGFLSHCRNCCRAPRVLGREELESALFARNLFFSGPAGNSRGFQGQALVILRKS